VRELFDSRGLLIFRNQQIEPADQVRLMALLGDVLTIPGEPDLPHGFVSNVRSDGTLGERELTMHSDWSWWDAPLDGICLATVEVADGASSTRYTDAALAYDTLPDALRAQVEGRDALHVLNASATPPDRRHRPDPERFQAVHPMVATTPLTGRKYLYVNETATHSIVGLALRESERLLQTVFDHLYRPAHGYEHSWHSGDVIAWNNRTMQHGRGATAPDHPRTLSRVVIGPRSLYREVPDMRATHLTRAR
jgi:alpha-ketoglutarate-dependent taurine dioxygenase